MPPDLAAIWRSEALSVRGHSLRHIGGLAKSTIDRSLAVGSFAPATLRPPSRSAPSLRACLRHMLTTETTFDCALNGNDLPRQRFTQSTFVGASLVMTWRFENIKEDEAIVHSGLISLNALFATVITVLAVYFLL